MRMPNFIVIGAARAGTTALYHYLKQHPQIFLPEIKEPRFFGFEGARLDFRGPGDNEYFCRDIITSLEEYRALFAGVTNEKAVGEISPAYLYLSHAPERIRHYIPNVRLVAIFRHPADRAFSNYMMMVREGYEDLTFEQALAEEESRIQRNWSFVWHFRRRGFYGLQLQRYLETFLRDQFKFFLYEDFTANPLRVIQEICRFLQVDDAFVPDMKMRHNVSHIPRSRKLASLLQSVQSEKFFPRLIPAALTRQILSSVAYRNRYKPKIPQQVRRQLIDTYRSDILLLQELIDRDLAGWLKE